MFNFHLGRIRLQIGLANRPNPSFGYLLTGNPPRATGLVRRRKRRRWMEGLN